jgi:hypothetical protein
MESLNTCRGKPSLCACQVIKILLLYGRPDVLD